MHSGNMLSILLVVAGMITLSSPWDTAWDEFNLVNPDDHLLHEHFVGWMFGNVDLDTDELYFQLHDNDGNAKLDGLELFHALHHQNISRHKEQTEGHFFDDSLTLDFLLKQADTNNDGYLDYYEYVQSRNRHKAV